MVGMHGVKTFIVNAIDVPHFIFFYENIDLENERN